MRVYIASVVHMADAWKRLRDRWRPEIEVTSRWIDIPEIMEKNALFPIETIKEGWLHNEEDVFSSDALVCFGTPHHKLRGALVEVGMALAFRVPVICVGDCPSFSSWKIRCQHVSNMDGAHQLLLGMSSTKSD